jgi:Phospholipase_D-nuclease N-terminal
MLLATSTFLQVLFAAMIVVPVMILWVAAVVDVIRHGESGLKIAAILVLILIVPIVGPLLYFVFRRPESGPAAVEAAHMAAEDQRREAARRPVGGTGLYR